MRTKTKARKTGNNWMVRVDNGSTAYTKVFSIKKLANEFAKKVTEEREKISEQLNNAMGKLFYG